MLIYEYITVMRSAEAIVRQRTYGGIAAEQAESRKPPVDRSHHNWSHDWVWGSALGAAVQPTVIRGFPVSLRRKQNILGTSRLLAAHER